MIKYFATILSGFWLFSVNAHDFSLVVRNKSTHPFDFGKTIQVPGTSVSDKAYLSDTIENAQIPGGQEVRYYICLSLEAYISREAKEDRLFFKNGEGRFDIKFSNIDNNPCPEPLLSDGKFINVVLTDSFLGFKSTIRTQETMDGPYKITSYFDRDIREHVVLIEDSRQASSTSSD